MRLDADARFLFFLFLTYLSVVLKLFLPKALGPEHEYEGIFLKKRKKLQQLAVEASSCKLDVMLSNKLESFINIY